MIRIVSPNFERVIGVNELETIASALREALEEIHHPGSAAYNKFDVLDLIDQAQTIVKRAVTEIG
jgi:hypothetical protein